MEERKSSPEGDPSHSKEGVLEVGLGGWGLVIALFKFSDMWGHDSQVSVNSLFVPLD